MKETVPTLPQYYLIVTLVEDLTGDRNSGAQRLGIREISEGGFLGMVILRRQSKLGDERVVLAYGGDKLVDFPVGARQGR